MINMDLIKQLILDFLAELNVHLQIPLLLKIIIHIVDLPSLMITLSTNSHDIL